MTDATAKHMAGDGRTRTSRVRCEALVRVGGARRQCLHTGTVRDEGRMVCYVHSMSRPLGFVPQQAPPYLSRRRVRSRLD